MTDREKLVKILGDMPGIAWSPSARGIVADHLLANGVTVQNWIPVTERLPERFKNELCWYEYRNGKGEMVRAYGIGFYFRDDTWGGEVSNGYDTKVLAWMPLPEPPKEEA